SLLVNRFLARNLLRSPGQQFAHVVVASLRKVLVILADSLKEWRRAQTDGFIRFLCKFFACIWWSYRHCRDDFRRTALLQCLYRCAHGRASGQSVINQDRDLVAQLRRGASFTINLLAPLKFGCFPGCDRFNCSVCVRDCAHDVFIQNAHTARCDRASSQFFKSRHSEFAHDENVEWCAQALRHFISNRNAAARQTEHDYIGASCIFLELLRQLPASFCSVWKSSVHEGFPSKLPEILSLRFRASIRRWACLGGSAPD